VNAEILPVHGEEWEDVSQSHAGNFPNSQCTSESLKRKFQQLYRVKKLTGDLFSPPEVRMAKCLCHLITTNCEIEDAEGVPLPPDVSFDDDVIGDKNLGEDEDDEEAARNEMVLAQAPPIEVAPVARGKEVLAPLPQNISGTAASCRRAALKNKSNYIPEVCKLKILQKDEEREAEHERYEGEREERACKMRMRCNEEERHFMHDAEMRKVKTEARQEEMKAEVESHPEEAKAFHDMMMIMMLGKKKDANIN
jgi:hypothetical protein